MVQEMKPGEGKKRGEADWFGRSAHLTEQREIMTPKEKPDHKTPIILKRNARRGKKKRDRKGRSSRAYRG